MKKSILTMAIGTASASLLLSSGAMAFDSVDWQGGGAKEYHQTHANLPLIGTPGCVSGNCTNPAFGTVRGGEASSHIIITNKTAGGPSNAYTPTVDCYTYSAADYVFDGSGNPIPDTSSPNFTSGDMTAILRTNNDNYVPGIAPPLAAFQNTGNVNATPTEANLCTDSEGKITGGTYGFFAVGITGINSYIITDWDPTARAAAAFQGGTPGTTTAFGNLPTVAQAQAAIATFQTGVTPSIGPYSGPSPGAGDVAWDLAAIITVSYETCDITYECGQFGKSVPVPAFAAAALGLGLLGITYLTGRRRAIK